MTNRTATYLFRFVTRVVIPLAAVLLFAPAAARAGCDDHLFRLPSFDKALTQFDDPSRPAPVPATPKPCSGPLCSEHREPLTPPPAPTPTTGAQEWACWFAPLFDPDGTSAARRADDGSRRPVRRASSIFHPPRS